MPYESNPTPWNSKTINNLNIENKIKPTNMDAWFCTFGKFKVQNIDLSNIDTSNVTSMEYTFSGLSTSETSISFAGWDTSKVRTMEQMFIYCTSLTTINYGNNFVNTGLSGTNNRRAMFDSCPANKPDWW